MSSEISKIDPGSLAFELELEIGDKIISINGQEVKDILDYRFLMADEYILLEVEKSNGEIWEIQVEKEYDENLGVEFKESIMDKAKRCSNNCIFCFIDQLPKGMRDTLYFKDDDSRLSFLQGNFVTLTNLTDEDIDRIIKYRISPINVSVHTTNPDLRVKMLGNKFAGNVYKRLEKIAAAGIAINCQIVLCPGINNGTELEKTAMDLFKLYPAVQNVAAVPIGLTKFREGLFNLTLYDRNSASIEIENAKRLQEYFISECGKQFLRLSDEFYVLADIEVPTAEFYEGFHQLEDGVGIIRAFHDNINNSLINLNKNLKGEFTFVTGVSSYNELCKAAEQINNINNKILINVMKVKNNFFGETITVAGLITGKDIIEEAEAFSLSKYILIPDTMLRKGYEPCDSKTKVFLDDTTVNQLEEKLNRKILICDYTGEDLIDIINMYCEEVQ
ncbi:MAG: DUF512 domain-containing protein [Solirubrobacterales bacterium]